MLSFNAIREALLAPGSQKVIMYQAPIYLPDELEPEDAKQQRVLTNESVRNGWRQRLDYALDCVVRFSGSQLVFFTILVSLLVWALMGIRFGHDTNWQILISNVQAILCYVYDSLLMRQQFTSHETQVLSTAVMRSRMITVKRMLRQLHRKENRTLKEVDSNRDEPLPQESVLRRMSTFMCRCLGHFTISIGFWVCIIVWISFGPLCNWDNTWQLYINSATSALMIFVFAFLANIRTLHDELAIRWWRKIMDIDVELEKTLRAATGMATPNQEVKISPPNYGKLQRAIFYYADIVGTLVGIIILLMVFAVWLAIGPALHFNSNWWLIIGTYAGLVGMHDGLILHNVQDQLRIQEDNAFDAVELEDAGAFDVLSLSNDCISTPSPASLSIRISARLSKFWANRYAILAGMTIIVGLLVGATALEWSFTGQLLCNVPPSIIESYIMIALIAVHSQHDEKRRAQLQAMHDRRIELKRHVDRMIQYGQESQVSSQIELLEKERVMEN